MSARKPHQMIAGYVTERICHAPCGGHVVIYDRNLGFEIDAEYRWIVMHEPSSLHVSVSSRETAYAIMYDAARGGHMADILPEPQQA